MYFCTTFATLKGAFRCLLGLFFVFANWCSLSLKSAQIHGQNTELEYHSFLLKRFDFPYSVRTTFVTNNFVCQVQADRFLEQIADRLTEPLLTFDFRRSISHAHNAYGNKEHA